MLMPLRGFPLEPIRVSKGGWALEEVGRGREQPSCGNLSGAACSD